MSPSFKVVRLWEQFLPNPWATGLLLVIPFLASCDIGTQQPISRSISAIRRDIRDLHGTQVTTEGSVGESFAIGRFGLIVLRDSGVNLAVISSKPAPAVGSQLRVSGTVCQALAVRSTQVIVVLEEHSQSDSLQSCELPVSSASLRAGLLRLVQ